MITATELRLLNWIYPNDENNTPWQIRGGILNNKVHFGFAEDMSKNKFISSDFTPAPIEEVRPIPLTTEILLKSGFVFNKQFQRYEVEVSDGVECVKQERLEDDPGSSLYFFYMIGFRSTYIKLEWLHQLQNVHYYISGFELSITL